MEKERGLQASGAEAARLGALVPLVLASGSPRRAGILRAVGWPFQATPPEVDKPRDEEDARRMLRTLSGRWHEVLTGVALVRAETGRAVVGLERTRVRFAEMSDEEIRWHVATGDVLDKA